MEPIWHPNSAGVVSAAGSSLTLGEKVTRTQIERGEINEMERRAFRFPRGAFGFGKYAGFRVMQASVTEERGNIGVLTVQWEVNPDFGGNTVTFLPPDDFDTKPFEINPPVHQHPNYSGVTGDILALLKAATEGSDRAARESAYVTLAEIAIGDDDAAAAIELIGLLDKGVQTYYLTGVEYIWWTYSWGYPATAPGGVIEAPGGPGVGVLDPSFSWLRLADLPERENGYYKLTRSWRGAPNGHWSTVLYS